MAPLKLTIRTSPQNSFTLEFEDNETVEALAVAIFSLDPELGEELRLAHKGRPLKEDLELRAAGVQSGDVIAVARKAPAPVPAAQPPAPAETVEVVAPPPPQADDSQDAGHQSVETAADEKIEAPVCGRKRLRPDWLEEECHGLSDTPAGEESGQTTVPQQPADPSPDHSSDHGQAQEEKDSHTQHSQGETQEVNAQSLLEMARRLEAGDGDAHPAMLVAFLQRAGARMQALENAVGEAGHALQILNHFSAHALRGIGESVQGMPAHAPSQEEGTRSFMIKKGDADVQEAHRLAALHRPSAHCGSPQNSHAGGVLSSSSTPMTKADMDRARQARLDRLEQQQAEKKRANEEAAARAKAKEAMFEKPLAGAPKPLGKF